MRIYLYNEGLARFATESIASVDAEYIAPNRENIEMVCMHLTNYAINKSNQNFVYNESAEQMDTGHKRSLTSVIRTLKERGYDTDSLWQQIKDMIIKTFLSAQPVLAHHYKSCQPDNYANNMCFEVLGLDVMLDESFKPYLLEVNYTPSFSTDTPLDKLIKKNVIRDCLTLMNITHRTKTEVLSTSKETMMKRMLTGKKDRLSQEEKAELSRKAQEKRDEWEDQHLGGYERIYPTENIRPIYAKMLEYSQNCYEDLTGTSKRRSNIDIKRNVKKELTTQVSANMRTTIKNEELEKIYKKPPMNPFNKTATAIKYERRINKSCVKMSTSEADEHHTEPIPERMDKPLDKPAEKPSQPTNETYYSTRHQQPPLPRKAPSSSERNIHPIFKVMEKRDSGNYLRPRLF